MIPVTNFTQIFNNSAQAKVLDALLALGAAETITTTGLVDTTGLSRRAVMENLGRLQDIDLVNREGNGKLTFYWSLNNKSQLGKRFISIRDIITNVRIRERLPPQHVKADAGKQTSKPKRLKKGAE